MTYTQRHRAMKWELCFLLVLIACCWAHHESPVVRTVHGSIRGSIMTSRLGRQIHSFRGIPLAKPPTGELRFQPPVPPDSWNDVLNATEDGPSCPSLENGAQLPMSEDCLYLNVYTTEVPRHGHSGNKPVIVFFHPGAWYSFTPNSRVFGPHYLLDQDVVLVIPSYRLAALGYLSANDSVLSGNYGMKDQVAALRWVRDNIAGFGGDPNQVTIAGYSAGSASVMLHMVSPMSRGLFHRVIASSGSALSLWSVQPDPFSYAQRFARLFNCPSETSQQIRDCLLTKDAQEMANSIFQLADWASSPGVIFGPVIETNTEGERFLVEHPMDSFASGNFAQVPVITGMNTDEFGYASVGLLRNETLLEDMNTRLEYVLPLVFQYERDTPRSHHITRELRKLYFQDRRIDNSTAAELDKMFRDGVVCYGMDLASKVISQKSQSPVYHYKFSYQGRYSFVYKDNTTVPYGVVHHDDLMYWFYIEVLFPFFKPEDPETQMVEKLTTLWTNFAKTGNPTPTKTETLQNVTWEPLTIDNLKYLDIGSDLEMKTGLYQETLPIWSRLFYPNLKLRV